MRSDHQVITAGKLTPRFKAAWQGVSMHNRIRQPRHQLHRLFRIIRVARPTPWTTLDGRANPPISAYLSMSVGRKSAKCGGRLRQINIH